MLLTASDFQTFAQAIATQERGRCALDLETRGLSVHKGARAFLIGVAHTLPIYPQSVSCYLMEDMYPMIGKLLSNPTMLYGAHGWKFEGSFFKHQLNVQLPRYMWDTEVFERVRYNDHMTYALQACAVRDGLTKYPPMLEWLKKAGHKERGCPDCEHYALAPPDIIVPYVEQDAVLSLHFMNKQIEQFKHWDTATPVPIRNVVELELRTTPMLLGIESEGLAVDLEYCKKALAYERDRAEEAKRRFKAASGIDFTDSAKCLSPVFNSAGLSFGRTDKGNASFTAKTLAPNQDSEIVRAVLDYRDANKRASSYWENFISFAGPDGKVHPNIRQTGARTSRMSVQDPACQTWTDDDESPTPYPIRRAFKSDHPDCYIVSIDYRQMEVVLSMDEAGEVDRMEEFKRGADFHKYVAERANCKRSIAKNGKFAKQYGAGPPRIADTVGCSLELATKISQEIDKLFPKTAEYSRELTRYAKREGMCYNWLGRRYFFERGQEYKAFNYRTQGGCGEILRIALCDVDDLLRAQARPETRLLMPIHDEGMFRWHRDDLHLIEPVKQLMCDAFKSKRYLDMEVSVSIGKNFFDLEPYDPGRNYI